MCHYKTQGCTSIYAVCKFHIKSYANMVKQKPYYLVVTKNDDENDCWADIVFHYTGIQRVRNDGIGSLDSDCCNICNTHNTARVLR